MTLADDGWGSNISYELLAIIVALVAMSALGHERTFAPQKVMSALPPKADGGFQLTYVIFAWKGRY